MVFQEIIYYTCNTHLPEIDELCLKYLRKIDLPVVSVSLNKSIDFGNKRIVVEGERGPLMMLRQILLGLEASEAQYVFLAENDVLYHPTHFEFTPLRDDTYYFNTNIWKMRWSDGFSVRTDNSQQLSGLVANRELLLNYFRTKEPDGHYEPKSPRINYESRVPNICIRHDNNLTRSKWSPEDYRNKEYAKGWREGYEIPGWDNPRKL